MGLAGQASATGDEEEHDVNCQVTECDDDKSKGKDKYDDDKSKDKDDDDDKSKDDDDKSKGKDDDDDDDKGKGKDDDDDDDDDKGKDDDDDDDDKGKGKDDDDDDDKGKGKDDDDDDDDKGKGKDDDDDDDDDDKGKGKDDDDDDDDDDVRICHATGSDKNPYVSISLSSAGAANGHMKHGDDIIPPFEYNDKDLSLNWDSEGKEIWKDDCEAKDDDDDDDDGKDDDEDEVTAVKPTVKQSEECEVEGSFTIPDIEGVEYLLDGEEIEEGTYSGPISGTITAEADGDDYELTNEDFEFELDIEEAEECPEPKDVCPNIEGIQTSVPSGLTVNSDGDCVGPEVAGTESPSPKPTMTPTKPPKVVVHQPTGVPTAVNAGIGGDGPTGAASAEGIVAQALVGGGLLFLMAAGGLQVGRRTSGAHQV